MEIKFDILRDHSIFNYGSRILGVQGDHLTDILKISFEKCGYKFSTATIHFTLPDSEPKCTEELTVSIDQMIEYEMPSDILLLAGKVLISVEAKTAEGRIFVSNPTAFETLKNAHGVEIIVDTIAELKERYEAEIDTLESTIARLERENSAPKRPYMAFWYMDGTKQFEQDGYYDDDWNWVDDHTIEGVRDSVNFPTPTDTVISFKDLFSYYYEYNDTDNATWIYLGGLWAKHIIGTLDVESATSLESLFANCKFTETIGKIINTHNIVNFRRMFCECNSIQEIPPLNTSSGTDFGLMFYRCRLLESLPELDTTLGTAFNEMFSGCTALTSAPSLNVSKGTDFNRMFNSCSNLTSVPELDTRNGTNFAYMFTASKLLKTVPLLDFRNATNVSSLFSSTSITHLKIKNIKINLQVASSTYGTSLTVDSLVGLCYELIDTGATKYLTIGSVNIAKLANVFVKKIAVTDEMRAEDEFIDSKLPFVVCESTDEGAMNIKDYILEKKWSLK